MNENFFTHDRFFKRIMSNLEIAKHFLQLYLPIDLMSKELNWNSLRFEKTEFIDDELKQKKVDVLFSLEIEGKVGYFFILVEHQSKPQRMLPWRIHQYVIKIMQHVLKKERQLSYLPLVYPFVFYTGKYRYHYSLDVFDCFNDPQFARKTWLQPIQLISLREVDDEKLMKAEPAILFQYFMKHIG